MIIKGAGLKELKRFTVYTLKEQDAAEATFAGFSFRS